MRDEQEVYGWPGLLVRAKDVSVDGRLLPEFFLYLQYVYSGSFSGKVLAMIIQLVTTLVSRGACSVLISSAIIRLFRGGGVLTRPRLNWDKLLPRAVVLWAR